MIQEVGYKMDASRRTGKDDTGRKILEGEYKKNKE
jgi:hypothetical protein